MNKLFIICASAASLVIGAYDLACSSLCCFNQTLKNCSLESLINMQVLEAGKQAGSVPEPVIPGRNGYPPDPLVNLMYTSGSSGRPKGAEYTESMYCSFLQVFF